MSLWVAVCLVLVVIAVAMFLRMRSIIRQNTWNTAMETMERNHPDLAALFRSHKGDKQLRRRLDRLMRVSNQTEFYQHIAAMQKRYPDFQKHVRSLGNHSKEEIWRRFVNHRPLATMLLEAL